MKTAVIENCPCHESYGLAGLEVEFQTAGAE